MKALPAAENIPSFFRILGFDHIPTAEQADEIRKAYREKARIMHPDAGGTAEDFQMLTKVCEDALEYLGISR